MPPTRYLGLPWPEWGETDVLLTSALDAYDRLVCACCNQFRDQAHDPATEGRWQPVVQTCYAGEALAAFREDHKDDLGNKLVGVRLLKPGEVPADPMVFDPARAAAEYADLQRRHGAG